MGLTKKISNIELFRNLIIDTNTWNAIKKSINESVI